MKKNKSEMAVTQGNPLIESRYKLSLSETKLFLWMVKEIHPGDKDFKTYRIYLKDFIESTKDVHRSDLYTTAKTITKGFLSKVLELENGTLQTHFMSRVKYFPGEAYIEYRFEKDLKPYLIQLKGKFKSYDIQNIINCRYSVSIRIYQLLKSFEDLGERTVTVKDLRFMLVLEKEYSRFYDFKRFVLERAMKDLKKYSDIYFGYSLNKRGRNIHSVTFTIKKQRQRRLFDGKPEPSLDDAIPAAAYHKPADDKLHELEEAEKDAGPIPDEIKKKLDKWT
jgi:plasmid replication initiation protein